MDFDAPKTNDRYSFFVTPPLVSGLYEGQKMIYKYANPNVNYPILRMPFDIHDGNGNTLSHGMYMIVLDEARRYLLFVQSNTIKARVPVAEYREYNEDAKKDLEKREELAKKHEELNLRGHQRKAKKVKEELEIHNKRIQTKMSASIDTSQKGVYILNYANAFETAFAIIPVY